MASFPPAGSDGQIGESEVTSMKRHALMLTGIGVTALLMLLLVYAVLVYIEDPSDPIGMMGMGALSSGLMVFLVIFALVYSKPTTSSADYYMEAYQGICSRCRVPFGPDGICPECGHKRPEKP